MRLNANTMSLTCLLTLFGMLVQGCASDHRVTQKVIAPKRVINDIITIQTANSFTVVVQGDQPLAYTFMQQNSPQELVINFADTAFDRLGPVYFPPDNFAIYSIRTAQNPENDMEAGVVLELKGSTPYQLVPEGNSLNVVFAKTTPPAQSSSSRRSQQTGKQRHPSPAANITTASGILKEVNIISQGSGVKVHMVVDGRVKNFKTFTIDDRRTAMIVVDLLSLRSAFRGEQKIPVEGGIVNLVRHFGHPEKVRVVVETNKKHLKDFSVKPVENGIVLEVGVSTKKED